MTRHGSRDGTHFRKKLLNADGPVERILILLVIAVVAGVTIGLLMPKANPTVGEITGEYTASGSAAQTLQQLTVDVISGTPATIATCSASAKPTTTATDATCAKTYWRAT